MARVVSGFWKAHVLVLMVCLISTAWFAAANVSASDGNCCGDADLGSCTLDYPYRFCSDMNDCANPNFHNCCFAGGFCDPKEEG